MTLDDATSAILFRLSDRGGRHGFDVSGLIAKSLASAACRSAFIRTGAPITFFTAEAGVSVDRKQPTQVGRALERLGVEHIAAYSPQARGRSERVFQTLQDRLVKELALAGIDTIQPRGWPSAAPRGYNAA